MNSSQTNNASPRTGLSGGRLALLVVLTGLLTAIGLYAGLHWQRQAPVSAEEIAMQQQRVSVAESLQQHAEGASVPLVQLLVSPERDSRVPLYKQIDTANLAAEKDMGVLAALMPTPQDKARLDALRALRMSYEESYTAAVEQLELAGSQGALAQFWAPTRDALAALVQATRRFAEEERTALAMKRMTLEAHDAKSQRLMWVVVAVALLAAALGGVGVRVLGGGAASLAK